MPDYIPQADPAVDTWQDNFMTVVAAAPADYGLVGRSTVD